MNFRPTRTGSKLSATLLLSICFLAGCASTGDVQSQDEQDIARGREQLIRAFDAAWVRVLSNGKVREILDTEPAERPGAANGFVVRMADCLPLPELTPYPEKPVGLLKKVLDTGEIRRMVQRRSRPNPKSVRQHLS